MFLKIKNIDINFEENIKKYIAKTGYDKEFGARLLKRIITNTITNPLSEKILSGDLKQGDKIYIDIDENNKLIIKKI